MNTVETLKRFLEHAPPYKPTGANAASLRGWICGEDRTPICNVCAGRIMARGCHLPNPSEPVWNEFPHQCVTCG